MKKFSLAAGLALSLSLLSLPAFAHAATVQNNNQAAVDYVLEQKIMFGQLDGVFHGETAVTRLEFTMATVDAFYKDENFEGCFQNIASTPKAEFSRLFNDVSRESWYGKRLCVAMHAGLISGDRDGNFRPFDSITAAEASKILAQAYGFTYPSLTGEKHPWFWAPMMSLSIRNAIPGDMRPAGLLHRQEMATMFYALRNAQRYPESRMIGYGQTNGIIRSTAMTEVADVSDGFMTMFSVDDFGHVHEVTDVPGETLTEQDSSVSSADPSFVRPSHRLIREKIRQGLDRD